jgi:CheY-like chemotaxis protein
MLPPRAYAEPLPPFSANVRAQPSPNDARPSLIVAVAESDVERFPSTPYVRLAARTTTEAVRLIDRWRPKVIVIDWDVPAFDAGAVCTAAKQAGVPGILAVMTDPHRSPPALKAGCHSILLKPFTLNLTAARLGRLCREIPPNGAAGRPGSMVQIQGTNRVWADALCPKCHAGGAVSFEFSSHRRSWYACVFCEHVWLGTRRE